MICLTHTHENLNDVSCVTSSAMSVASEHYGSSVIFKTTYTFDEASAGPGVTNTQTSRFSSRELGALGAL